MVYPGFTQIVLDIGMELTIHMYVHEQSGYISLFYKFVSWDSRVVACPIIRNTTDLTLQVPTGAYM